MATHTFTVTLETDNDINVEDLEKALGSNLSTIELPTGDTLFDCAYIEHGVTVDEGFGLKVGDLVEVVMIEPPIDSSYLFCQRRIAQIIADEGVKIEGSFHTFPFETVLKIS
jgi:hypothetical protein